MLDSIMDEKLPLPHEKDPDVEQGEIATEDMSNGSFIIHIPSNFSPFKTTQYTTCNKSGQSEESFSKESKSIFGAFTRTLGFEITKFGRFSMSLLLLIGMTLLLYHFVLKNVFLSSSERTQYNYDHNGKPCLPSTVIGTEKPVLYVPNKGANATCADDAIYSTECDCYKVNIARISNSVVVSYLKRILEECIKKGTDKVIHIVTGHKHEVNIFIQNFT